MKKPLHTILWTPIFLQLTLCLQWFLWTPPFLYKRTFSYFLLWTWACFTLRPYIPNGSYLLFLINTFCWRNIRLSFFFKVNIFHTRLVWLYYFIKTLLLGQSLFITFVFWLSFYVISYKVLLTFASLRYLLISWANQILWFKIVHLY